MSESPRDPAVNTALREQAADWHVRLASDAAGDSDWLDFEAWLAADPAHQRAYEEIEALWSELDGAAPAQAQGNVVPIRRLVRPKAAWFAAAAAGLALAVGLGIGVRLMTPRTDVYETARGERETIMLADGSRLTLNGSTHLSVRLARGERNVVLAQGEAAFDVAKDPARPFLIAVGDRQVRVVGTEFNVLHDSGSLVVTVRRGIVEVRPANDTAGAPIARLHAGRSLVHQVGAARDKIAQADPETAFAWTNGRLIFRNERLEDVAKVLNRYLETPLVAADEVKDLRLTAVLVLDDENAMIRRLGEYLPVSTHRTADAVRIEPR